MSLFDKKAAVDASALQLTADAVPLLSPTPLATSLSDEAWPDKTAVNNWLEPFRLKSPHTYRASQRAVVYWLYFLEQSYGHHPDLLRRAHTLDTHRFVQTLGHDTPAIAAEQTANLYAAPNHVGLQKNPFHRAKSPRSVTQLVAALSSLYRFNNARRVAHTPALLDFNPFAQVGKFLTPTQVRTDRLFEPEIYTHFLHTIAWLQAQTSLQVEQQRLQRLRWITVALFNLWLRVSELAQLRMADFRQLGKDMWVVNVYGKGRKLRTVEITPQVLQELMAYRTSLGMRPLPSPHEKDPAVQPLRPRSSMALDQPVQTLTSRTLFNEVKYLGTQAANFLLQPETEHGAPFDKLSLSERNTLAQRLCQISPHWFRHSGASEAINAQFSIADAAERLGHHDPAITVRMYYHGDMKRRFSALSIIESSR